jgi:hypothetical protein
VSSETSVSKELAANKEAISFRYVGELFHAYLLVERDEEIY